MSSKHYKIIPLTYGENNCTEGAPLPGRFISRKVAEQHANKKGIKDFIVRKDRRENQ